MVTRLDLGFYFSDETRGPDWQSAGTFLVAQPGAPSGDHMVLEALCGASLPRKHLLVATSGSTAQDERSVRLVALSCDAFLASAAAVNAHLAASPADIWAHALPLFHVGGLGILARAWLSGSRVVPAIRQKWDARWYRERVAASRATLGALVPSQLHDLVAAGLGAPSSLRAVVIGGARFDPALYSAARALGWPCLPSYGMTETCSQVATAPLPSMGNVYPGVLPALEHAELRAGADGRIHVRASSLLTCYVIVDHETGQVRTDDPKRGGWFETEDLGRLHPGGVEVIGRAADTVKVLGELVNLAAVESAIGRWLDEDDGWRARIADFAVASVPHPRSGAALVLVVVPANGLAPNDVPIDHLRASLSRALRGPERPARIVVVGSIPRTALGKVQRARLADLVR